MWFAASVKMDKNSLSATCSPMVFVCLDLREEVITGKTLSMVCRGVSALARKHLVHTCFLYHFKAVFVVAM